MEVRLNSPRGKFQITNMAHDQVHLTPEDIPGATTSCRDVETLPRKKRPFLLQIAPGNRFVR